MTGVKVSDPGWPGEQDETDVHMPCAYTLRGPNFNLRNVKVKGKPQNFKEAILLNDGGQENHYLRETWKGIGEPTFISVLVHIDIYGDVMMFHALS